MPLMPREHVAELQAQLETHSNVQIKFVDDDETTELDVNDVSYDSELDCIVIEVY